MFRRVCALAVLVVVAIPASAAATKRMTAVRAERAPVIDGLLDDPLWQRAQFVSDFKQQDPHWGAEPSRRTDVAFAYDGDNLYVGARMHSAGPDDIQAVMTRRDDSGNAERIIISLDTYLDRRTAYSFAVTAAGVRVDWYHPDDNPGARDASFNPVWDAEIHIDADGWTAEMRIPFSQLRFPDRERQVWGVNLNRYMPQNNEDVFWIIVPKNTVAWASQFGELVGIEQIKPSRRLELLPYVAADATLTSSSLVDQDDPFASETDLDGRAGVDLKMGLGPNLTLDATFNPDFGQVEADPAVVNLSAFETLFAERRPFFVEGNQIFSGLGPNYFYSRRIGAPPRGEPDADYADIRDATRILGAAKVTGRLRSGLSLGALGAVTQETNADTYDLATGARGNEMVEPLTGYSVLRLQQELGRDASLVGLTFTSANRHFPSGEDLALQLARQAYTGGLDWRLRLGGGVYEINGYAGGSVVNGRAAAIERIQTSSAHYFQRPDQDHVTLDPTQRTMSGWTAGLGGGKRSGHWRAQVFQSFESPGLELNDTGTLMSADDISFQGSGAYIEDSPGSWYRSYSAGMWLWDEWNFGGVRKPGSTGINGALSFHNYMAANAGFELLFPGQSDDETRGGPLMEIGGGFSVNASVGTGYSGTRWRWNVAGAYASQETGDTGWYAAASTTVTPQDRIKLDLSAHVTRVERARQYIDTLPGGRPETYDLSYVFGTVRLAELAAQLRVQLAVTPNLSMELYAEPFASSGDYTSFGELAEPGGRELLPYDYGDDPDFTVLSLRSTFVMRWEFLPGSTLYLVWQQSRADELTTGARVSVADLGDAIDAPGSHTLALKLAYWWPVD